MRRLLILDKLKDIAPILLHIANLFFLFPGWKASNRARFCDALAIAWFEYARLGGNYLQMLDLESYADGIFCATIPM